jgi:hypothetical protein
MYKSFYRISLIILVFVLNIFPQVTIKEKVNINPDLKTPNYLNPQYTPCGPWIVSEDYYNRWQVVWNGTAFFLDPYQQLFNQQSNSYFSEFSPGSVYNIIVTKSGNYCYINELGTLDTVTGNISQSRMIGDTLLNAQGTDLIGTGQWLTSDCGTKEKENFPKYQFIIDRDIPPGTEIVVTVTGDGETINYHTIVETPAMEFETTPYSSPTTLDHFDSTDIGLLAYSNCSEGCGGYLPSSIKYTVAITQGQQYGRIYDKYTNQSGSSFSNIETEEGLASTSVIDRFAYIADGVQPDTLTPGVVKIQFAPSDPDLPKEEIDFNVEYNETPPVKEGMFVEFDKPTLSPGDTAQVFIKYRYSDGSVVNFPNTVPFEIGMLDGCEAGGILEGDQMGPYFYGVTQPIKFVAADSIQGDSVTIRLRVGSLAIASKILASDSTKSSEKLKSKIQPQQMSKKNYTVTTKSQSNPTNRQSGSKEDEVQSGYCFGGNFQSPTYTVGSLVVKQYTILLGETKYYQAEQNTKTGELRIEEIKPDKSGIPQQKTGTDGDWQWIIKNSIWGNNPVKCVSGDNDKSKVGVYWETGKPIWIKGQDKGVLSNGLIRVVGRYWSTGNTYKAKLIAKSSDSQSSILLRVNRPATLLSSGTSHSYMSVLDIYNKSINMDALLIEYAGKNGIPPQLLKGQMYQEAEKENFAFWPSYRYEPWQDLSFRIGKHSAYYMAQPYWVDQTGMGTKDNGQPVPTMHQNVKPILSFSSTNAYPNTPLKIGDYVADNLDKYYADKGGLSRKFTGHPYYGPASLQRTWNLLTSYYSSYGEADALYISDSLIKTYLRQTYTSFAQTRKAASYGFFQMLYTTAIETKIGYPRRSGNSPAPENLNDENVEFPYVMKALINDVKTVLRSDKNNFNDGNWENGLEQTWLDSYVYYNDGPGYNTQVFKNSYLFLPSGEGE